ncbi:MAG: hypothetical protein ABJB12_24030 [Pseudomonadota bacterium]
MVSFEPVVKGFAVSNVPPPLLGFNNNVRHRGRIFHIQTEDSGVKSPRIVTHLFADGGRIIKTARTEYSEHVARADVQSFVRNLMKEQHKAMFTALRMGDLDTLLEDVCGAFEQPLRVSKEPPVPSLSAPPAPITLEPVVTEPAPAPDFETPPIASAFGDAERVSDRPEPTRPLSNPNLRKALPSSPPPGAAAFDLDVAALERLPQKTTPPSSERSAEPPPSTRPLRNSNPPPRKLRPTAASASSTLSRPSARFAAAPGKSSPSLFGEGVISEQSLDEVILSYLAEDLDGSSE